jgi:2'-5' RNA ligase
MEALARAAAERTAFPFRLGGAGAFPSTTRARVVWIGPAEGREDMVTLAAAVAARLGAVGHVAEGRSFRPHLTVARFRAPGDAGPVVAALGPGPVGPVFMVDEITLYESRLSSQGPAYSVLERFPLPGGG